MNRLAQNKIEIMKILDLLQTGIMIIDPESSRILEANLVVSEMVGISRELLLGSDRSRYCACCSRIDRTSRGVCREMNAGECAIMNSNGTSHYILREILPIKLDKNKEYLFESFMDITERRVAVLELEKLKDKLEEKVAERTAGLNFVNELLVNEIDENKKLLMAIKQSPVSILISDASWCTEYVNPAFTKLTGYGLREIAGDMPPLLKNDIKDFHLQKEMVEVVAGGKEWKQEVLSGKKGGMEFWSVVTVSALRDDDGNLSHYIFIQEDISERKVMEDSLRKAKEKAEASANMKAEFLAMMSHEIRTPVNTMLSFASLLKMELSEHLTEESKAAFDMLSSGGLRLIRTMEMILSMADLQADNYEAKYESIDLNADIVQRKIDEFRLSAGVKKLGFGYRNECRSSVVRADRNSVFQIFINLLDNAIKFTNSGAVEVILRNDEENNVIMEVSDTGKGLSEDYIPQLFTPFSQEEGGYTRRFEGNGLGLALVKKYCDINDAKVEVRSQKGKGSTFSIKFKNSVT
ncbi:MAG: PAS domain-containing protein [Ignavibacteria bacterium]|jgi:PAS domain S-box-containing protein|nr:PAS domain-containing protein [Ignavibacteria bacterium]MCU7504666.1 PAS domain-containing protein [Ignavibacteria bacterium]MCU7517526.1 PAS domain-containing protein [Ignavibacteria bacterium]